MPLSQGKPFGVALKVHCTLLSGILRGPMVAEASYELILSLSQAFLGVQFWPYGCLNPNYTCVGEFASNELNLSIVKFSISSLLTTFQPQGPFFVSKKYQAHYCFRVFKILTSLPEIHVSWSLHRLVTSHPSSLGSASPPWEATHDHLISSLSPGSITLSYFTL